MVAAINDLFARSENNSERGAFFYTQTFRFSQLRPMAKSANFVA